MFFKYIYMFCMGYVTIKVEGFFLERFLNICRSKNIFLEDLSKNNNNTYMTFKILKKDFREIKNIAKKAKCKIKIQRKIGIPFFINRYRKRKIFAIAILVIAIFIFMLTRFIWNVEIIGNEEITNEDLKELVAEYGISEGKLKSSINIEKTCNLIRLNRDDISWIGISLKGTNAIITIEEVTKIPEIIDKNEICNIVATEDAIISKIIVQNGTARVKVGDEVKKGDLLVEGVMEGVHTENRNVHAEATVFGKIFYEKEKKESLVQNEKIKTGEIEEKNEICIKNFKINFNKGVSNFEKYDTITTNKKVRIFSNIYLPIILKKYINEEYEIIQKEYTQENLKEKILHELEEEFEKEYQISKYEEKYVNKNVYTNLQENELTVKLIYEIQKEITAKEKITR